MEKPMSFSERAVSLEMLDDDLAALVKAGAYDSEREVIRDALEALLDANPSLRLEMAITLWQQGKITMSRAIEIAHSDRESFRDELAARGVSIVIDGDVEEILKADEKIRRIRRAQ
jgi:predicted HTH domain antitoxin